MDNLKRPIKYALLTLMFFLTCMVGEVPAAKASHGQQEEGSFSRTYHWEFEDCAYDFEYQIPWDAYHFYQEKLRDYTSFAVYTYENRYHAFLPDFVHQLECLAEASGMDRATTMRFVIAFVQHLEYRNDQGEYPKFPVETLSELGGDCEDTSILLAAMLRIMGYSSVMINPPGHMALAVACEDCEGVAYNQDGRRYYYVETTAKGFGIGEIPEDYLQTNDKIISLAVKPSDLWLLYRFVPKRAPSGNMLYYVSEDAGLHMAKSQGGEPFMAKTTVRSVKVDGIVSTRWSFVLGMP